MNDDAKSSDEELTRLSRHLLRSGEEEKGRIARELHDSLGSSLTAVNMDLAWVKQRLADQPALAARLARAMEVLASTVEMKRRIIHELRPTVLDNLGLGAAIESHAADFSKRSAIPVETALPDELPPLKSGAPIALFRIFQEALSNAAQHAKATSIRVSLREERGSVFLEIIDNGSGIDRQSAEGVPVTTGLRGMRERAAATGGTLSIERGADGHGTVVRVVSPCVDTATPSDDTRGPLRP